MKKKLIVLMIATLFSLGAAIYANNSNLNVINETNVEALTKGPEQGDATITVYGEPGDRIVINHTAQVVSWEGKTKKRDQNNCLINDCIQESGSTCTISMSSELSDVTAYTESLKSFFKDATGSTNIISWIISLFKK